MKKSGVAGRSSVTVYGKTEAECNAKLAKLGVKVEPEKTPARKASKGDGEEKE